MTRFFLPTAQTHRKARISARTISRAALTAARRRGALGAKNALTRSAGCHKSCPADAKMTSAHLLVLLAVVHANENGLARTPPMGWRSPQQRGRRASGARRRRGAAAATTTWIVRGPKRGFDGLVDAADARPSAPELPRSRGPRTRARRAGWNLYGRDVDQDLIEKIMDGMVDRSRTVDDAPRPSGRPRPSALLRRFKEDATSIIADAASVGSNGSRRKRRRLSAGADVSPRSGLLGRGPRRQLAVVRRLRRLHVSRRDRRAGREHDAVSRHEGDDGPRAFAGPHGGLVRSAAPVSEARGVVAATIATTQVTTASAPTPRPTRRSSTKATSPRTLAARIFL